MTVFFLIFMLAGLAFPQTSTEPELPKGVIAKGEGVEILEIQYHTFLTDQYLKDETGQALMAQIINEIAIKHEATKRNKTLSIDAFQKRLKELDQQCRANTQNKTSLEDYIQESGVDRDEFFEAIRLSMVHEIMAREDWSIPADQPVPVTKLNIWLEQYVKKMEVCHSDEPNLVALIDGEKITKNYFGKRIHTMIGAKKAARYLNEMLGIKLIQKKALKMGIQLTDKDLDTEIKVREAALRSKPGLKSVAYGDLIKTTKGLTLEQYKKSPSFQAEVLLNMITMTLHDEAYLQDFFKKNQAFFNERYGKAARVSGIFLKAIHFKNEYTEKTGQRKFNEAEKELMAIKERIQKGEASFENMARLYSEHHSKEKGGDLGFIPIGAPGWKDTAKAAYLADIGMLLGPVRTPKGCYLLKVCDKREDPDYSQIRGVLVKEARQRYYQGLLKEAKIIRKF